VWAALHAYGLAQLLLLPLAPGPGQPWRVPGAAGSVVVRFHAFLLPLAISPWTDALAQTPAPAVVTPFILATAFIVSVGALVALAGARANLRSLATGFRSSAHRSDIVVLRWATRIALAALPVPLVATLLTPLACSAQWAGFACWSGVHVACAAVGVICAAAAVAWLVASALTVHLRTNDLKVNPLAAAHGRVDAALLVVKATLAAVYALAPASAASPFALALVNTAGGAALVALVVLYLPFHDQVLNRALAAMHGVFLVSAVAQLLAVGLAWSAAPADASTSAGLVWAFTVPFGFHAAWSLADARWRALATSKDVSSPYVVELRARAIIAHLVQPSVRAGDADAAPPAGAEGVAVGALSKRLNFGGNIGGGGGASGGVCPVGFSAGAWGSSRGRGCAHVTTGELASRRLAERVLKEGAELFSTSAIMAIFVGAFMHEPRENVHLERLQLHAAHDRAEWFELDVAAFIAQRTVVLEEEEHAANSGKMTVKLRLHFEALRARADARVADARQHILAFWTMLFERHPDLSALVAKGAEIFEATRAAEADYKDLLVMAPLSIPTLRAYAVFLIEVVSNPAVGDELLADAEQLEDEAARSRATAIDDVVFGASLEFDLTVDGIALVTVSSAGASLGLITDANVAALRLFGYTQNRREVLGRNVSIIIPEPFSTPHDFFLADFAVEGTLRISGRSTILFGAHRDGHIFPMHVHVSASSGAWTAALEEIQAQSLGFLIFLGRGTGYRVTAACLRSLRTFGFSVARLRGAAVSLTSYVADADALVARVAASPGAVVELINTASRGADEILYVSARVQELTIPHVADSTFVLRYREASAAEVDVAIATKLIAPRAAPRAAGAADGALVASKPQ
jgi:PAS domain S-box-containing protein